MRVCVPGLALAALWVPLLRAQDAGLPPEWEVRKNLASLVEQTNRLGPLLSAVKPETWVEKGAPEAYQAQWKSVLSQSDYLVGSAGELAADSERLTVALETLFRMQSLDSLLVSLQEGIAKYQNPALAELLRGAMSDGAAGQEWLRQYVVQLASVKEGQFKVMDAEAQRCRTMLLRQPPPQKSPDKKALPK